MIHNKCYVWLATTLKKWYTSSVSYIATSVLQLSHCTGWNSSAGSKTGALPLPFFDFFATGNLSLWSVATVQLMTNIARYWQRNFNEEKYWPVQRNFSLMTNIAQYWQRNFMTRAHVQLIHRALLQHQEHTEFCEGFHNTVTPPPFLEISDSNFATYFAKNCNKIKYPTKRRKSSPQPPK